MTEEEAKQRWCPFVREPQAVPQGGGFTVVGGCNTDDLGARFPRHNCIASACMAWRWLREEVSGSDADGFGYIRTVVTGGYCGLAGAVQ